jgi:hypothetical protein
MRRGGIAVGGSALSGFVVMVHSYYYSGLAEPDFHARARRKKKRKGKLSDHGYFGKNFLKGRKSPTSDTVVIGIHGSISLKSPRRTELKRPWPTKVAGTNHMVNQAHFSPFRKPVRVITKTRKDQLVFSMPNAPYRK